MSPFTVAIAGLSPVGLRYLESLRESDLFDVVALADTDATIRRKVESADTARMYEDYRSLVVETAHAGLDLLVIATEPYVSREIVRMAADRGIPVFHKSPFARTVTEGAEIIARFEEHDVPFATACASGHRSQPPDLERWAVEAGYVHTVTVEVQTVDGHAGWRGDARLSGGGVLLNGAYAQLDMLVALMGLPESVIAVCGFAKVPGTAIGYDTEDHAQLLIRWSDDRSATMSAQRGRPVDLWSMQVVGTNATINWPEPSNDDIPVAESRQQDNPEPCTLFASTVQARSSGSPPRTNVRRHLSTLAVLEAAYLSARTGSPETPERFLV